MKKRLLPIILVAAFLCVLSFPQPSLAVSEIDKINQQLDNIKKQEAAANQRMIDAKKQQLAIAAQKNETAQSIDELLGQIDRQGSKLMDLNQQQSDVEASLQETGQQLEDATSRVEIRDKQLKSRLLQIYTNGVVSYLDVLFSSTSFSDFLSRYDALQSIADQDKNLLEANKNDRDLIAAQKVQVEADLIKVQDLVAEAEAVKQDLLQREKEKEVMIASLTEKEQAISEASEEQKKFLFDLAASKQKLQQEKTKLEAKVYYTGGKLLWPLPGQFRITSNFGEREDPFSKNSARHDGIDIGAPNGTTIVAAESGTVLVAGWVNGYGNCVMINHGGGIWTLYGHIRDKGIKVKEGQEVERGQKIAEVGSTGRSTGNHLHFGVLKSQSPVNPMSYLKK